MLEFDRLPGNRPDLCRSPRSRHSVSSLSGSTVSIFRAGGRFHCLIAALPVKGRPVVDNAVARGISECSASQVLRREMRGMGFGVYRHRNRPRSENSTRLAR
jgi:hypothetical protein